MKYQELKLKHNDLLKANKALEEKFEELREIIPEKEELAIREKDVCEGHSLIENFKANETFDFSPYSYKRTVSMGKGSQTHFSNFSTDRGFHLCKTELNLGESLKEVQMDNMDSTSKKESNADLLDKDSFTNTSVLTNSDLTKLKPEILDKFRDEKRLTNIDLNLVKQDLKKEDAILTEMVAAPGVDPVQYYDDLRSNVVAIKYESCLKEEVVIKAKTPEKKIEEIEKPGIEPKMIRKSSFIEFTAMPSSFVGKGKKENSATRKSSRKSSDHMEKIHAFGEDLKPKIKDEIIEETVTITGKTPILEKKPSVYNKETKKGLFEEFLLIGIEKDDFLKIDANNQNLKGYLTPNIMFEYPKNDETNETAK